MKIAEILGTITGSDNSDLESAIYRQMVDQKSKDIILQIIIDVLVNTNPDDADKLIDHSVKDYISHQEDDVKNDEFCMALIVNAGEMIKDTLAEHCPKKEVDPNQMIH